MDNHNQHSNNSLEKYLKYFRNLISGKERHAFEKNMMQDKFEEEAFDGLSQLKADEFNSDIAELQKKIAERTRSKKIIAMPILRYAAAAVLVLSIGTLVILIRQSSKDISKLAEQQVEEDTSTSQTAPLERESDTLKKNIAYIQNLKKESKEEIIQEAPTGKYEPALQKPDVIHAEEEKTVLSNELTDKYETEVAEPIDAEESVQYEIATFYKDEMAKLATERNLQAKKSRAASSAYTPPAQTTVTGQVLSAADEAPLAGVDIQVKGTPVGTISDADGNFRIEIPEADTPVLRFASAGFMTEEHVVSGVNNITVALNEEQGAYDEVAVVEYAPEGKTERAEAVAGVQSKDEKMVSTISVPPKPIIGITAFKKYIRESTNYNKLPEFNKPVTVKLNFVVDQNGIIDDIVVLQEADKDFNEEAIRLLKEGPAWTPGTENGILIKEKVTLKIKFEPQD